MEITSTASLPVFAEDTRGLPSRSASVPGAAGTGKREVSPNQTQDVSPASDLVSLTAPGIASHEFPAPVYAEIWRGNIKLAQIDTRGQVTSFSGPVGTDSGSSSAGGILAAQRTIQLAQQFGGEIRVAGLSLDHQTVLMRARLETAYSR